MIAGCTHPTHALCLCRQAEVEEQDAEIARLRAALTKAQRRLTESLRLGHTCCHFLNCADDMKCEGQQRVAALENIKTAAMLAYARIASTLLALDDLPDAPHEGPSQGLLLLTGAVKALGQALEAEATLRDEETG